MAAAYRTLRCTADAKPLVTACSRTTLCRTPSQAFRLDTLSRKIMDAAEKRPRLTSRTPPPTPVRQMQPEQVFGKFLTRN